MVRVAMPRSCAVRRLSPCVARSVSRITVRSISSSGVPIENTISLRARSVSAICFGRSARSSVALRESTTARSMVFSSSRTLPGHAWPGNVRELENTIERAVVLSRSATLDLADLPKQIADTERARSEIVFSIGTPLEEIERTVIRETLRATQGDKRLTAQLLGIATRTIYRKLADC